MTESSTRRGVSWPRVASFIVGVGMAVASAMTIQHFFDSNFPTSIYHRSFCDINAFFNCDSSAYSEIAEIGGVPLGYLGLVVGFLVSLGAVFPSTAFERTNKMIALLNAIGVVALLLYSVVVLESLCLLCAGYYFFAISGFVVFWKFGPDRAEKGWTARWFRPSLKHLLAFGVFAALGAYGFFLFHAAKREAVGGGTSAPVVEQYFELPEVHPPSIISPFWSVKSTERFEDAAIQVIEYGDFLCPDCLYFTQQMKRLEKEFAGSVNVAYQFFPLDAQCNDVVDKDRHPGACDLSYIAAHDPDKFGRIHDEIYSNFQAAKDPEWRKDLAVRYGVEEALEDEETKSLVHRIIRTGAEYEKTSDRWAHGIRSTPTMIINNRMVIGTFPYAHLRAIFKAIVEKAGGEGSGEKKKFLENWVPSPP